MFRYSRVLLAAIAFTAAVPALAAPLRDEGGRVLVSVDQARVLKIDRAAETVIIGNPSIVDVTVHDSTTLVLTGRSYGVTNLVILDGDGKSIVDEEVAVQSYEAGTVRIFRQAARTTVSCLPNCEPTVTIGDEDTSFNAATSQFSARQSMASGSVK
jgi:Flp pilus assembly secretin CpaC